jgi:uncharacterized protein YycO
LWSRDIIAQGESGDWILSRSYYLAGDAITLLTRGEKFSHAAMYDAKHHSVVEAVGSGVRELPLQVFLQRNHYVALVRPSGMTASERQESLVRARAQVGKPFDDAGMIGIDNADAFYCSELVAWASNVTTRFPQARGVITPADLMKYSNVVYWSGTRSNEQTMEMAQGAASNTEEKSQPVTIHHVDE